MDGIAVNPIDRLKYRGLRWLLEKLYERPAGFLIAEGAMPASIHAMDRLFQNRQLGAFLPYEVFTDEGLFKSVYGKKFSKPYTVFSFALALKMSHRLEASQARAMALVIEQALPPRYVLQAITARLPGEDNSYTALLCLTAPNNTPRDVVLSVRDRIEDLFHDFDMTAERLDPNALLQFVNQAFDLDTSMPYDDHALISSQCGFVGVNITPQGVELKDADGDVFRHLHLYTTRRYGMGPQPIPFLSVFPSLVNDLHFIAQFVGIRDDHGLIGQFVFADITEPGEVSQAQNIFASRGWLIEKDVYNAHLSFLSLLPMAVSVPMAAQFISLKRWRRFSDTQVQAILPLPFQANVSQPASAGAVVHFKKEAAYG